MKNSNILNDLTLDVEELVHKIQISSSDVLSLNSPIEVHDKCLKLVK